MVSFALILAFPLLVGLCFGLAHVAGPALGVDPKQVERHGLFVYAGLLVVPLGVAAWGVGTADLTLVDLGLATPTLPGGLGIGLNAPGWAVSTATVGASIVGGVVLGWMGYHGEKWLVTGPLGPSNDPAPNSPTSVRGAGPVQDKTDLAYLTDGAMTGDETDDDTDAPTRPPVASEARSDAGLAPDAAPDAAGRTTGVGAMLLIGVSLFSVVAEEVLWRGYLIAYAGDGLALDVEWALLLSAVAFGSNHAQFGWRNVVSKCVLGLAWGGLFLATGSLLAPIVSHFAFNALALGVSIEW